MRGDDEPCCEPEFWVYLVICAALVSFASITSGLSLGLLSFSQVDLEVLIKSGQPQDRKNAAKILPLVKNQHLLLCTLLIGKSLAIEALPIFLDSIAPVWEAILISVTLVLVFGEIIPQAVCARYALSFGAKLSLLVRFLLFFFFPVSYPISKLLDRLLGKGHSALLRRAELRTLVDLHGNEAGRGGELSRNETTIITGALDLTEKTAKDAMTPLSQTFSLDINSKLDMHTMHLITSKGHSRIPIYSGRPTNIIGLILVKNLIFSRPEDETPIKNITIRRIPRVHENWPLYGILSQFQTGHSHMAVVVKSKKDIKENAIPIQSERKAFCQKERRRLSSNTSLEQIMEHSIDMKSPSKISDPGNEYISMEDIESLPSGLDEEVVGIITMEDVMEELLQEEILDETDVYVDVHNQIKINLLPKRSSPRSPNATFGRVRRISPMPSPLSSYHTPMIHSPISPYIQSPLIGQILTGSVGISIPNSPAKLTGQVHSSPSSHQVSRKSFKKLRPPGAL